ncbi:hypothetical protein N0V88_003833 [Collariella sp. IMI 366227]|nr:hypothetical protein N0V88_003833 [Collariella sp. IMI 366227]
MSSSQKANVDVPTLPETHSGIPPFLLEKAKVVKQQILEQDTKPQNKRRRSLAVPQGIERDDFVKALVDLQDQLGAEHVEINDKPLQDGCVEEVQTIVRWANKHRIPIFPISMGRNLGYGGRPRVRGSVTIDLGKRMNKILDLNAEDYTCLVEPGVSFYALYEEVKNRGCWTSFGLTRPTSAMYTFPNEEDLAPLIDIIRPLRIALTSKTALAPFPNTPISPSLIHTTAAQYPTGDYTWAYYGMTYGPPLIRAHKLALIDREFRRIPGARRIDPSTLPEDEYFWARDRVARGVPDIQDLCWLNWVPNGGHVAFSPVAGTYNWGGGVDEV